MSRHWIAEEMLALEAAIARVRRSFNAFGASLNTDVTTMTFHAGSTEQSQWSNEIATAAAAVRVVAETAATQLQVSILAEYSDLKAALWTIPLPKGSTGGHLRAHPGGEPLLIQQRFVPAPLTVPTTIDMNIAVQAGVVGNCRFVGAIRLLAEAKPQRLPTMAVSDPLNPDDYVLVRVATGEYRLRATLAWDGNSDAPAGVTSPDGTTLVPYIEKAAAAHFGALNDLHQVRAESALAWLVGKDSVEHHEQADLSDSEFAAALSQPACIVAVNSTSHPRPPDADALAQSGLVEGHAYNVAALDSTDRTVALSNPWGILDPDPISFETLRKLNIELTWIKNPPGAEEDG